MTIYQPNIPQASDVLSESQADLSGNFISHNEFFGIDHVRYSATSGNGKHNKSTYVAQGAPPATAANEIALFAEDNGNGFINLKARYQSNGPEIGVSPFATALFSLGTAPTLDFSVTPININQAASSYAGNAITLTFTTAAADTNYYVFVQMEFTPLSPIFAPPLIVHSKTVNSFVLENSGGISFNLFSVMVYHQ